MLIEIKQQLVAWMFGVLTALAPAEKSFVHEEPLTRAIRVMSVAEDIVDVAFDPSEDPIFVGPQARTRSAVAAAVFAVEEGMNLSPRVDDGTIRGDGGRSYCVMQINVGKGKTPEGWTGPELIADRKKCIRSGYRALRRSYWACSSSPEEQRFAAYASGRCDGGIELVKKRHQRASWTLWKRPAPKLDL